MKQKKIMNSSLLWLYGFFEEEWFCSNQDLLKFATMIPPSHLGAPKRNDLVRCKDWSHYNVSYKKLDYVHMYINEHNLTRYTDQHEKFSLKKMKVIRSDLRGYKKEFIQKFNIFKMQEIKFISFDDWVKKLFFLGTEDFSKMAVDGQCKKLIKNKFLRDQYYYLDIYFPKRYWGYKNINSDFSRSILDFKEVDKEAINVFSERLHLVFNCQSFLSPICAIAMCPSSQAKASNEHSPMSLLIKNICNASPQIFDATDLLIREKTIHPAHMGGERSIQIHIDSIKPCKASLKELHEHVSLFPVIKSKHRAYKENLMIILLDDVLTTGSTINACENIIINVCDAIGSSKQLIKFTLAKTRTTKTNSTIKIRNQNGEDGVLLTSQNSS